MAALLCGVIVCLGMRYSMVQGDTTFFDGLLGILYFVDFNFALCCSGNEKSDEAIYPDVSCMNKKRIIAI